MGLTIIAAALFAALSAAGWAIENPIGVPTVPQSSFGGGLVTSPSPIDRSGNLVITGNISGGRHFQGIVPYGATSDFSGALGSTSLDSFLRRSAGSVDLDSPAGTYTPYFSPSRTVATTRPGLVGVIRPPTTRIDGRAVDRVGAATSSGGEVLVFQGLPIQRYGGTYGTFGLVQITPQETSEAVSVDVGRYDDSRSISTPDQLRTPEAFRGISEGEARTGDAEKAYFLVENRRAGTELTQLREELKQMLLESGQEQEFVQLRGRFLPGQDERIDDEARFSEELAYRDGSLRPPDEEPAQADTVQAHEPRLLEPDSYFAERRRAEVPPEDSEGEAFLELRRLAEPLDKTDAARFLGDEPKVVKAGSAETTRPEEKRFELLESFGQGVLDADGYGQMEQPADSFRLRRAGVTPQDDFAGSDAVSPGTHRRSREEPGEPLGISREERAKDIMGPHKTIASFSEAKFNQHIKAAEVYLEHGKYYRAADAYSLASIYKAESAFVYMGKSHALFAAGEYMSSALFLSRALEMHSASRGELGADKEKPRAGDPDDIAVLTSGFALIDRDKLESRVVDVEEWQQRSDSPELQFLLSYIYYQMGWSDRAKEAISAVREKMPESQAVIALKEVIDSRQK
ncbi:MAG: tetratricopeptide repeat protein [Planctomycetota bacterium]